MLPALDKSIRPVINSDFCGPGAMPLPKFPAIPALSKKSESKMTNPLDAVTEAMGVPEPE